MVVHLHAGRGLVPTLKWLATFFVPWTGYHAIRYSYFAWEFPNTYYAKLGHKDAKPFNWNARGWKQIRTFTHELWQGYMIPGLPDRAARPLPLAQVGADPRRARRRHGAAVPRHRPPRGPGLVARSDPALVVGGRAGVDAARAGGPAPARDHRPPRLAHAGALLGPRLHRGVLHALVHWRLDARLPVDEPVGGTRLGGARLWRGRARGWAPALARAQGQGPLDRARLGCGHRGRRAVPAAEHQPHDLVRGQARDRTLLREEARQLHHLHQEPPAPRQSRRLRRRHGRQQPTG